MQTAQLRDRQTSVDAVFEHLQDAILSLQLLPGDKISEAEIAARFGVSRQPVRDAFSRLENLDLLLIRPQRATEVKRFSAEAVKKSRFVRAAVEAEVLRRAAAECSSADAAELDVCIDQQREAVKDNDCRLFGALDYNFHQCLCRIGNVDFAFDVISSEKAKMDRLCMLGLAKEARMPMLLDDHTAIAEAVKQGDAGKAVEAGMLHLSRLDSTIEAIQKNNPSYFEP